MLCALEDLVLERWQPQSFNNAGEMCEKFFDAISLKTFLWDLLLQTERGVRRLQKLLLWLRQVLQLVEARGKALRKCTIVLTTSMIGFEPETIQLYHNIMLDFEVHNNGLKNIEFRVLESAGTNLDWRKSVQEVPFEHRYTARERFEVNQL
jgi:hypothetical protein